MKINNCTWTVLIYTLVLVILGVFMASVVLNVAVELWNRYKISQLESSLIGTIKTKWDLSMKYARQLNSNGSGFVDTLSCPDNISLSGSVNAGSLDTELRILSDIPFCRSESLYYGNNLDIFFNADYSDLQFAELQGSQVAINSWSLAWIFSDGDSTTIDLWTTAYFSSDGIDDNFDSDNYSFSSTGTTQYPDSYSDNDDDAKLMSFGYIVEDSGLYNILWSNSEMSRYIEENTNNIWNYNINIWDVSNGHLYLDIDNDFRLVLYEIDKWIYDTSSELVHSQWNFGTGQLASIWYVQNDMSLSPTINSDTLSFDFTSNNYALFIENISSWALLYKLRWFEAGTASGIYLNPLKDDDISVFSYLGSHVLVDEEGRLIGDQMEIFWLK